MLLEKVKDSPVFSSLVESLAEKGVEFSSLKSSMQERIARLVKFAPGPASTCAAKPDLLLPLLNEGVLEEGITSEQLQSRLRERMESAEDPWLAIRRFHRMHIMRIALRDLCELAEIDKITEELSDLADAVIAAIHDLYWEELIGQYGIPYCMEKAETAHLCVIAMGKHGGRELNFSSDVDLMFVYDYEGETEGDASGSVENQAFFTIFARKICDFLTKTTAEGYLYRVDTRLRPEGEHGPLASSLSMIEEYYHSYGQNWERQALLKARPVAGHSEVGQKFLKLINPFTYRKYVDELEIADVLRTIDAMRNKSLEQLGSQQNRYLDFKNGYGGIRDIEFFAQAVQILYGGQYPEIRQAGTLLTLLRMHESGLLHSREFGVLALAYRFLRRIEHRMQMEEERQVYKLPTTEQGLQWLAENMGYPSAEELTNQYNQTTAQVRELYQGVFKRKEWEDDTEVFLEKDTFDGEIEDILKSYNFQNPRSAFNFLQALKHSPDPHLQPKTNRLFKAFLPRLLSCLKQSPDPDMALGNFEKLVTSFRARSALYETFSDQPPYVDLLVSVISGSSFLTRLVLRDPSLMETIGRDFTFEESITRESLQTHFHLLSLYGKSDVRDRLLRVQNAAMLRSGIRFILGLCSVEEMGHELAIVADFILAESMPPCHAMMRERYADFTDKYAGEIGILGMGKLGGREFNVASDCDLMFIYETDHQTADIMSAEYFSRWAAKFVDFEQRKDKLGFLYEVDARLRPYGSGSMLASSQQAFLDYFNRQAQFWEKMALSRARFVCGNPAIDRALDELKQSLLFSHPIREEEIQQLLSMRKKIEASKKKETLKAGPGGIVDVEFIAQALVLYYGWEYPSMRTTSTLATLREARTLELIPIDQADELETSYIFLREVENRLRIVNNVSMDHIPDDPAELKKLTKRYALRMDQEQPSSERFLLTISTHTKKVRSIYHTFFAELLEKANPSHE